MASTSAILVLMVLGLALVLASGCVGSASPLPSLSAARTPPVATTTVTQTRASVSPLDTVLAEQGHESVAPPTDSPITSNSTSVRQPTSTTTKSTVASTKPSQTTSTVLILAQPTTTKTTVASTKPSGTTSLVTTTTQSPTTHHQHSHRPNRKVPADHGPGMLGHEEVREAQALWAKPYPISALGLLLDHHYSHGEVEDFLSCVVGLRWEDVIAYRYEYMRLERERLEEEALR